jgi:hypothetical protein
MTTSSHDMRWGGAAGIGALVLALIAGLLLRDAPDFTESASTVGGYLATYRSVIMTAVLLYSLAVGLFVWFGATLSTAFRRADDRSDAPAVVLAGFVVTGALGFIAVALLGSLTYALTAHPVLLVVASGPYAAVAVVSTISGVAVALPMGACAYAIARTAIFPQWMAWFAGVVAVLQVLAAITLVSAAGVLAPGSVVTAYIPGALTAIWVLCASVLLVREHLPSISPQAPPQAMGPA